MTTQNPTPDDLRTIAKNMRANGELSRASVLENTADLLASLREQVADGDKRVLQLMSEIEMREGNFGKRWIVLREILEGGDHA